MGTMAEWSNAHDSKSCSFGSACSNQACVVSFFVFVVPFFDGIDCLSLGIR